MKNALFALVVCCAAVQSYAAALKSETFTLESRVLLETRRINVFIPPGHDDSAAAPLPVLYMPDGGTAEDFPHVAETVQTLVAAGRMPPVLLVGIENTERRRDLTGPTEVASDKEIAPRVGGSAAFRQFIRTELMPYIKTNYRTTNDTGIVGESLAGLFIVETLLLEPELFDRYVAISPSVWWNNEELVRNAGARIKAMPASQKKIFLTSADEENIHPGTARLAQALRANAPANVSWTYMPMPNERHDTIYRASEALALEDVYGPAKVQAKAEAKATNAAP